MTGAAFPPLGKGGEKGEQRKVDGRSKRHTSWFFFLFSLPLLFPLKRRGGDVDDHAAEGLTRAREEEEEEREKRTRERAAVVALVLTLEMSGASIRRRGKKSGLQWSSS